MRLTSDIKFKKLAVTGDRVLIRPSRSREGDMNDFLPDSPIFVGLLYKY